MRLLRHFQRQDGIALVMALGMLIVLTIVGATATYYATSNARSASSSQSSEDAYSLAESGIAEALSRLANAASPTSATLLPPTTIYQGAGSATYSGALSGTVWTITSTGDIVNTTGPGAGDIRRTLTRQVSINSLNVGSFNPLWNRFYVDNASGCTHIPASGTVAFQVPVPFATRGDLCLDAATTMTGSTVDAGGNLAIASGGSIGISGTPIQRASIAGTCSYNAATPHAAPCTSSDHVYASTSDTSPQGLTKPPADFSFWWANAKPGPKQGCTTSTGTPPTFDNDAGITSTWNGSVAVQDLTPEGSSYTCQVKDAQNNVIGELSWNTSTRVLTIKGTIFIDGQVQFNDSGTIVHYQGRATLWAGGSFQPNEIVCAGGSGSTSCRASAAAMSTWDPSTNLLVVLAQSIQAKGTTAYQGMLWAQGNCKFEEGTWFSGPIVCDSLNTKPKDASNYPHWYTWPSLPGAAQGQLYSAGSSTDFQLILGNQSG